ncbi:MAG: T9SS type A sorting domain-containing protein [Calditrichaeota bacterium]|nr:T9SS type A sorting domain-containing protein [Calditrichota bacterium]MCB9367638.1 T9SS type A sorting domain-containing protein [Calditrichota bacterium]
MVIFVMVVRVNVFKDGRFQEFVQVKAMDAPELIVLRGKAGPAGSEEYQQGLEAYGKADYKKAAKFFADAVAKSPEQGEWWLVLGVCQVLQREPQEAIVSLKKAEKLTEEPSTSRARWFMAQSYLMTEELGRAVKLLEGLANDGKAYRDDSRNLLTQMSKNGVLSEAFASSPRVSSPRGGESFVFGSTIKVAWNKVSPNFDGSYEVWLSNDGGLTCFHRLASLPADQTSWTWETRSDVGNNLALRIEAVSGDTRTMGPVSQVFSVSPPLTLTILDPKPQSTLYAGIPHEFRWALPGLAPKRYKIDLWRVVDNKQQFYKTLYVGAEGSSNSWKWEYPDPVGKDYVLRLEAVYTDSSMVSFSEGTFQVLAQPEAAVTSAYYDPSTSNLGVSWSHSIANPTRTSIYLQSVSTSEVYPLSGDASRRRGSWEGGMADVPSGKYEVHLSIVFPDGEVSAVCDNVIEYINRSESQSVASAARAESAVVDKEFLKQNYPNPFNNSTTIEFDLESPGDVELKVFNVMGQEVKTLMDGYARAGSQRVVFDATGLASGVYIYRLVAGDHTEQKRMILAK